MTLHFNQIFLDESMKCIATLNFFGQFKGGFEVVKRWSNEAIEAVASDDIMVQYHALGFLYLIRKKSDGLAVSKMVSKLIKTQLKRVWPHLFPKLFPPDSLSSKIFLPNKNSPWI